MDPTGGLRGGVIIKKSELVGARLDVSGQKEGGEWGERTVSCEVGKNMKSSTLKNKVPAHK